MSQRGLTLIELIVTVAIVSLLATMAIPVAELAARRMHEQELRQALRELRTAIDAYHQAVQEGRVSRDLSRSSYPRSLRALVDGVEDVASPTRARIYFLRRIPRDPFNEDRALAPADSWGLRSYASPPDNPQAGDDVFDVYSLAPGEGLNGIPYREW